METERHKKTIELADIMTAAWKRKWLIVIPLILVTALTYAGSYMITPEYESSVIIWLGNPVRLSDQLRRMVGDAGNVLGEERHRNEELRSLQNEVVSSPYIKQLVDNLKLDQDPGLDQKVQKARASRPDLPADQIKFEILLNELRDDITVNFAGWEQVRISVRSRYATRARDMAQTLGEILMAEKMKQEIGSVRMSQDFTYEQLAKYERELQEKIDEKTNFEREYLGNQSNNIVVSDSNQKAVNSEIESIRNDIEDKKQEERTLLGKLTTIPADKLVVTESAESKRLKDNIQNMLGSIANLLPKYRWNDPEILNFKTRLYEMIGDLETENKRLVEQQFSNYDKPTRALISQLINLRSDMDIAYAKSNSLKLALSGLAERISSVPEYQARLDQLNREINVARDLRDRFKEQQEGSQISQALLRESRFQVIEPAKVPLAPFKPNRPKLLMMGIALGLMLGAGAALIAELTDNTLKKIEEIEDFTGYPILGIIPEISVLKKLPRR
jgi:protein tyrosine kinase modulator